MDGRVGRWFGWGWVAWMVALASTADTAKRVAYIHGDVSADGAIPSGRSAPYHQMLLTDTGALGCSQFRTMIEAEGYLIQQHYDRATTLDAAFLAPLDVVVFGLHQKVWSADEGTALDQWIRAGGGILMFSDSAAGGHYQQVNIRNPVGQTAVNSILRSYGMEVAVDQGGGIRAYTSPTGSDNPVVSDRPVLEGEGVSPTAVDLTTGARALIPLEPAVRVSGNNLSIDTRNITIGLPRWAALAHQQAGQGHVMALFDRQPLWNGGPGSDISKRDNRELLRRIVLFLAGDYANTEAWFRFSVAPRVDPATGRPHLRLSYRQWAGGAGTVGVGYTALGLAFRIEQSPSLAAPDWVTDAARITVVGSPQDLGDGTEQVALDIRFDAPDHPAGFARLSLLPATGGR